LDQNVIQTATNNEGMDRMKRIGCVLMLIASLFGCSTKPIKPKPTVLHVTAAETCKRMVVGTIGNMEYQLETEHAPLWAACWGPVGMAQVGSDFPATVDLVRGVVILQVESAIEDKQIKPDKFGFQMRPTHEQEYMIIRRVELPHAAL
jgi:hypothetical protein